MQLCKVVRGEIIHAQARSKALQHALDLYDISNRILLKAHRNRALIGHDAHIAVAFQPAQRLAHRNLTHVTGLGDLTDNQAVSRAVIQLCKLMEQKAVGDLSQSATPIALLLLGALCSMVTLFLFLTAFSMLSLL